MKVEIDKALRKALKTGEVWLGSKRTIKALRDGEAKLIIMATDCPEEIREEIEKFDTPAMEYKGDNMALGGVCGKPFSVATLAILEPGESEILNAIESH